MTYLTGFHAIEERLRSGRGIGALLVAGAGPRGKHIADMARDLGIPLRRAGQHELDRLAPDNKGIALEIEDAVKQEVTLENFLSALEDGAKSLVVIIDEITDPHNYGAILRSCDQFGVDLVVSRSRRSAKRAASVAQTSAGASVWVPQTEEANLPRALEHLKNAGFWVYGADMAGASLCRTKFTDRTALVLGGETGLSRLLKENSDALIAIPTTGKVDSLNVSVAAGIFLYEITRQRNFAG
jgi:23S rRNA (guanosine2251-2'-O)-methyltransferase